MEIVLVLASNRTSVRDLVSALSRWTFLLKFDFFFYFSTIYTPGLRLTFSTCLNVQLGNYSVKLRSIPVNTLSLWNFFF